MRDESDNPTTQMLGQDDTFQVLGRILFLIFLNDLDDDLSSKVRKYADGTMVFRTVTTDADKETLQDNLTKLVKWSEKWQMLFNFGKCKCIHVGNVSKKYFMGNTILGTSVKQKDLGVTVSADMTVLEQCGLAAAMGNQILWLIRRNVWRRYGEYIIYIIVQSNS